MLEPKRSDELETALLSVVLWPLVGHEVREYQSPGLALLMALIIETSQCNCATHHQQNT